MTRIEPLQGDESHEIALADLLIDAVADNAGVSFMHPLSPDKARTFWRHSLEQAALGKRIVFGALDAGALIGTVTLILDCPENQPHRGEIAKMIVARGARRKGVASQLLTAAESAAKEVGRTLLTLDAVSGQAGARLYERRGWKYVGDIPDYALRPDGTLEATSIYYKRLT